MRSTLSRVLPQRLDAAMMLAVAMAALFVFMIARGMGIYPVVFADEWSYSSYSRLLPLSEAGVPSYLYLLLYSSTSVCGDGFLDCARVLNCVFMVLAMPFIYRVARLVCSPVVACLVAFLAVAGPINTYAIYFMPEAMYFMGFWILTWAVLTLGHWPALRFGLTVGLIAGFLSLVKVHALFIVPALVAYAVWRPFMGGEQGAPRRALQAALAICVAFLATKYLLGYLLAGRSALTIFGTIYGSQANGSASPAHAAQLVPKALSSLTGHVLALSVLFTVPLACLATGLPFRRTDGEGNPGARVRLYTALVLGTLLAVVALFTATAEGSGPLETAGRLHMRYYNFAFPLLLVVVAAEFRDRAHLAGLRGLTAGILVAVAGYASFALLPTYTPSMVDSPELRGVSKDALVLLAVGALAILSTITWVFRPRWGAALFLFVAMPVLAVIGTWQIGQEVRTRQAPDVYEDASQFTKRYLGPQVSHLTVVAPHPAPLLRALFHLDNIQVASLRQDEGTRLVLEKLPKGTTWVLLIGKYDLGADLSTALNFGKFSLVQIERQRTLDLKVDSWPGVIRTAGLSWPEAWGTWSNGREVVIEFATSLPRDLELTLTGHAFATNNAFPVQIGSTSRTFRLPSSDDGKSSAVFHIEGNERIVRISIPHPTVPKVLGQGDDPRELGLGLRELKITAIK